MKALNAPKTVLLLGVALAGCLALASFVAGQSEDDLAVEAHALERSIQALDEALKQAQPTQAIRDARGRLATAADRFRQLRREGRWSDAERAYQKASAEAADIAQWLVDGSDAFATLNTAALTSRIGTVHAQLTQQLASLSEQAHQVGVVVEGTTGAALGRCSARLAAGDPSGAKRALQEARDAMRVLQKSVRMAREQAAGAGVAP